MKRRAIVTRRSASPKRLHQFRHHPSATNFLPVPQARMTETRWWETYHRQSARISVETVVWFSFRRIRSAANRSSACRFRHRIRRGNYRVTITQGGSQVVCATVGWPERIDSFAPAHPALGGPSPPANSFRRFPSGSSQRSKPGLPAKPPAPVEIVSEPFAGRAGREHGGRNSRQPLPRSVFTASTSHSAPAKINATGKIKTAFCRFPPEASASRPTISGDHMSPKR